MVLGRPKKAPHSKPKREVVPTEPPVFAELERRGLVVVMSEGQPPRAPGSSARKRSGKTRAR